MDTVAGLPHFIRVVETGSFSKAAADGGITQPTATQPMVASEARLGAPLFHRSTRGVTLTEVGTAYHEKCQAIAHELGEGDHLAAPMPSRLQGSLRISTSVAFGRRVLTPLVLRYMRDHPGVQIDLGFDDRYVNLVEQGIDVAIRMGRLADSALGARYLGVNPWVLVGSADYLARRGVPAAPAELSAHDALIYSSVQGDERWHFGGADGRTLQVPVKPGGAAVVRRARRGARRRGAAAADRVDPAVAGDARGVQLTAAGAGEGEQLRRLPAAVLHRRVVDARGCCRLTRRQHGLRCQPVIPFSTRTVSTTATSGASAVSAMLATTFESSWSSLPGCAQTSTFGADR